jgi:hypothetical protein
MIPEIEHTTTSTIKLYFVPRIIVIDKKIV